MNDRIFWHRRIGAALSMGALLLASAASRAQFPVHNVSGTIVDASGRAMPRAEIARYFSYNGGSFHAYEPLTADEKGRFKGGIQPYKLPMTYMVLDKDRRLGALVTFTAASVKKPVKIVLKALAELRVRPEIEGGYEPVSLAVSLTCPGTNVFLSYDAGPFRIPEGDYGLSFVGVEFQRNSKPFSVRAGQTLDLGSVAVPVTPITSNIGKPAMPLEFAEARGVRPDFRLTDLKGKWVLLEFWGYW